VKAPWYTLEYTFTIEKGVSKLPKAPISAKATEKAQLEVLERV
jgi:hypothetical protein